MYSRKEHADKLAVTFGFDCTSCRAGILRDLNAPDIGAVVIAQRDDGLHRIAATTTSPVEYVRRLSDETKREHTLVHSISALDTRALEGQLRRRLDTYLDARRAWYDLPPAVLDALCATTHLCDVPSPYLSGSDTGSGFSVYVKGLERAIHAAEA